ncbi:proteasome ATPase [Corynebacterium striatum]|uniref:proteasome ATPase n=1 Tax=Corynebacterium striatum TaxID=43770 RepID=UPI001A1F76A4|nr:proteasome ATPase [Corynebacterium striatum]HAT1176869.1 proteasome ATPase [Corynebacterium striatum]HAT1328929.1 proteasome ATPase [Corynebacterium striatum]HAT1331440.1 proteasome ATPase [Corynebacterium striatum]HAT1338767.1 proteasome ATPase [Corynebacterium striatum]
MNDASHTADLKRQIDQLVERNTKLASLLQDSRNKLQQMLAEVNALSEPASTYGVFLGYSGREHDSRRDAEVYTNGRPMRLKISPNLEPGSLSVGQQVRLGDGFVVVEGCGHPDTGNLATVQEKVDDSRAIVANSSGEEQVVLLATRLREGLRAGDTILIDSKSGVALEKIEKTEVAQLSLEEVPDVTYEDIGGLDAQISQIRDSVELPFLHPDLYRQYDLEPPKGVLLYGPPGCGKTLIAKAVANSLANKMGSAGPSYFLNVKGPELLNKYVGETERRIRLIFERARELAALDSARPVIVFFDEMESIFRTRGSGVSSDMETTVVPQLLTELDGVEKLGNVIVIGATNREELIDPAIMRPGRLDIKIRVNRPNKQGARDIFSRHLGEKVPHQGNVDALIDAAVEDLYSERPFVRLHYLNDEPRILYYRDFVSGAMIANIIARAKKLAIKEALAGDARAAQGITENHLRQAIAAEQAESEYVPTSASPEEWTKIVAGTEAGAEVTRVELMGFRSTSWHAS